MNSLLKTAPAVYAVREEYQILALVEAPCVMWVKVGDQCYYDDSNGVLRSAVEVHRMHVPMEELEQAGEYTVCYRAVLERKPYFSETGDVVEMTFPFKPLPKEKITLYQLCDAHSRVEEPVAAAKYFESQYGKIDCLILNGDIPNHSGKLSYFENIFKIIDAITGGEIPVIFARGNHDTRGLYAEKFEQYTPQDAGNSYFPFRLGPIWGLVLDTGEDKPDSHEEYGNTNCFEVFRRRETAFIQKTMAAREFEGAPYRMIFCHDPFTRQNEPPFNIEEALYREWASLLKEMNPQLMLCGHTHQFAIDLPRGERDAFGQPCPILVGPFQIGGMGVILKNGRVKVICNDHEKVIEERKLSL